MKTLLRIVSVKGSQAQICFLATDKLAAHSNIMSDQMITSVVASSSGPYHCVQMETDRCMPRWRRQSRQTGALAVLTALLLVPLIGMLAFCIDIGYLLKKRAELQRAADAATLAAVRDLVPEADGLQDIDQVISTVREYSDLNIPDISDFNVLESDITIGRFDPDSVHTGIILLQDGILDTVRVTLRRDNSANSPLPLLFGGIFGMIDCEIRATSTAVLQKACLLKPGAGVLPFAIPKSEWDSMNPGDIWSIYGNGQIENSVGNAIPGNWGTVDIGASSNSTADLNDQILNGLNQESLDALYAENRIPQQTHIDSSEPLMVNADPGFSAGIKSSLEEVQGQSRLIPIYETTSEGGGTGGGSNGGGGNGNGGGGNGGGGNGGGGGGNGGGGNGGGGNGNGNGGGNGGGGSGGGSSSGGNNVEYNVIGWAVAEVYDSYFQGSQDSYVKIKKSYMYDSYLEASRDLSQIDGVIEGAYTSPVLVE